ncbi:DNA polymerase I [Fructilactobacillus myrtifloralis]|uniref:DNA polymerase I n=1 Tax=Fructilactobacillus myrtifloralis TaxID=2940301 RepID=A0ABY5BQC0_9LACO|nr:DNA polymerase I [Fructilactobacillus myrtifloralis]USS85237.1 DNA polymerase I [Fructilactobacillus myrtifloralis]
MAAQKILLIDGNSLFYKAFFALYQSLDHFTNEAGLHTNALYGFNRMLNDMLARVQPDAVLAAFDAGETTFRTNMYHGYKSGRDKMPEELREQFPYVMELLQKRGIKTYELADYEADDIIGTTARQAEKAGYEVTVVTGDRDLTQLCSPQTTVKVSKKGVSDIEAFTPTYVEETMGITPEQIVDVKGLQGDTSDNYPGVEKVGPKTALKLVHQFGTIENLYQHIDEVSGKKLKEHLVNDRDQAFLSKQLATIKRDAPLTVGLKDMKYRGDQEPALQELYQKLNFRSFLTDADSDATTTSELPEVQYTVLTTENAAELDQLTTEVVVNVEMLTPNYHVADQVGLVIGTPEHWYVTKDVALLQNPHVQGLLENPAIKKDVFDNKAQRVALHRDGIALQAVDFDMLLVSYLLNTLNNADDVGEVARQHHYNGVLPDQDVYGKGKSIKLPADDEFYQHLTRKALAISRLKQQMLADLDSHQQAALYREMELPLSQVLGQMEITGIRVDRDRLEALKSKFIERVAELEQGIYQDAGTEFNVGSPKQLGEVLFEKLQLPVIKKTKTGYSTSVDVLEKLAPDHPIIAKILAYRQLTKLISTYIDGIESDIQPDHKVHTRYLQTLTQTGRLSSVDPNLQNIPVRTEEGRKIREAFVPSKPDWVLFSSDYSQIELRVLAAISGDPNMKAAFANDEDIHAVTARRIFELAPDADVDANLRRQAKAVNFGIVYGISSYGLSQNTGISNQEAKRFIEKYFHEYPGVKQYMDASVAFAKDHGYVETIAKRRRYIPEIKSRSFQRRQFAERIAMNSPIQGSAADIIKAAMIKMNQVLAERGLQARMLLQIHDELIFEAPVSELETLETVVPKVMDSIVQTDSLLQAAAVNFDVPLKVESHYGNNWYNIKK